MCINALNPLILTKKVLLLFSILKSRKRWQVSGSRDLILNYNVIQTYVSFWFLLLSKLQFLVFH